MPEPAKERATYKDLYDIPENMTGEIINGELIVTPRPSRKHGYTATALGVEIASPYQFGRSGGPGGWVFIIEPEIGFGEHILVPDLAGWREERYPEEEPHNWISVVPDWLCEVLSPDSQRRDKMEKMPIYARYGVTYLWLIDPIVKTLDVFRLEHDNWVVAGLYVEDVMVRAEPFTEIEFSLSNLWQDTRRRLANQKSED